MIHQIKFYRASIPIILNVLGMCLLFPMAAEAASSRIDSLTGLDQSFTLGNQHEEFSEKFHSDQMRLSAKESEESAVYKEEDRKPELNLWQYHRQVSTGTLYDSGNTHDSEVGGDIVNNFSTNIGMDRHSEHTYVGLFYQAAYANHIEREKENTFNHSQTATVGLNFSKLKVKFTDAFSPARSFAQGERTELETDPGKRSVTIYSNAASLDFDYKLSPKTNLGFGYQNNLSYFPLQANQTEGSGNNGLSTMTHSFKPRISYQLRPKIQVYGAYTYEVIHYIQGGRFGAHVEQLSGGLSGRLSNKTGFNISGGVKSRDYKDVTLATTSGYYYSAGLSRKLTQKISASITATHDISEDLDIDESQTMATTVDSFGTSLSWTITPHLSTGINGNVVFKSKEGDVIKADPVYSYQLTTGKEESTAYDFGADITWSPRKYLSLYMAYNFSNLNPSFKTGESESQQIAAGVDYAF
jgi:hypothetical protein